MAVLSTGKIAFPLTFDNGDVEQVYINPHDKGLQERIKNFEKAVKERIDNFDFKRYESRLSGKIDVDNLSFEKLMEMPADELAAVSEQIGAFSELEDDIEKEICAELDKVFDSSISEKAFKYVPPLSFQIDEKGNSQPYIFLVMEALADEIQKYGNKLNNATNKYISKYQKK